MNILGKSKLNKEILRLYFSHPEKKYYLRELERILKKPVSYVRKSLLAMEKEGLFRSEFQGKERFFSLNKEYPLYGEVKRIVAKTIGVEGSLKKKLEKIGSIEIAFIFGSYAKGDMDGLSDIDLMIVGDPDENKLVEVIRKLENQIDREINYHIFSPAELRKRTRTGDSFIQSVLKKPKILIIGDAKKIPRPD